MHTPKNLSKLTIIQHNVNGWRNKRPQLIHAYSQHSPDIILLNEIAKGNAKGNVQVKIPGYTTYQKDDTSLSIKHNIKHKPIEGFESQVLAATINTKQGEIVIATDYISPSTNTTISPSQTTTGSSAGNNPPTCWETSTPTTPCSTTPPQTP